LISVVSFAVLSGQRTTSPSEAAKVKIKVKAKPKAGKPRNPIHRANSFFAAIQDLRCGQPGIHSV